MDRFVKGDIVVLPFPFSDLSSAKKRPAIIIATLETEDIILCPITSTKRNDRYDVDINTNHFKEGNLKNASSIRPNRLFTADKKIILYKAGAIKMSKLKEVENKIVEIITK